jgi:hypothetical protein
VGQVHLSESHPTPVAHRDGRLDTRRISVPRLAAQMPYPVYGAYLLLTQQTPAADRAFTPIPIEHEDAWQNAAYFVQWWLFAPMALVLYGWLARKEAHGESVVTRSRPDRSDELMDRVAEYDRRATEDRATEDPASPDRTPEPHQRR